MKVKLLIGLLSVSAASLSSATTILLGGGTTGAQFVTFSSTVLPNTAVQVGFIEANVFTAFAGTGTPQIGLGAVSTFAGRFNGQIANTSAAADAFNGKAIFVAIPNQGGITYVTSSSPDWVFKANAGGVGDSTTISASQINGFNAALSTVPWVSTSASQVILGVPEPSAALLGALGALGLLRRRRN